MDNNWQVKAAICEKEGLLLKAKKVIPDAILLDSVTLNKERVKILEQLQLDKTTQSIPIILFTTKLLNFQQLVHQNSNVIGTIHKPFDALALSKNISEIIKRKAKSTAKVVFLFNY